MEHRLALRRNMAQSLIEHGFITTTVPKAKNLKPFVEKIVTMAVRSRKAAATDDHAGALRTRRQIEKLLVDRSFIPAEHRKEYNDMPDAARAKTLRAASGRRHRTGEPRGRLAFTGGSIVRRLLNDVAPKFMDRQGGYTRLIRLPKVRLGDGSPLARLQFLGNEEAPLSVTKPRKTTRKRKADSRYGYAVKAAKNWGRATSGKSGTGESASAVAEAT